MLDAYEYKKLVSRNQRLEAEVAELNNQLGLKQAATNSGHFMGDVGGLGNCESNRSQLDGRLVVSEQQMTAAQQMNKKPTTAESSSSS